MSSLHLPSEWRPPLRQIRFRIGLGWGWQALMPWLIVGVGAGSLMAWFLRGMGQPGTPAVAAGGGLVLVGLLRALEARARRPVSLSHALSRLDDAWGMGQSLLRALSGLGDWPALPDHPPPCPLQLRWQVWAPPVGLSLLMVALSLWIPPPVQSPSLTVPRSVPLEWREMEGFVDALQEERIVAPESLDALAEEVERLKALPEREWYGPAGLEATDRLRERVRAEGVRLAEGLQKTANLLQIAEQSQATLSPMERSALNSELQQLLQQMGENGLSLPADQLTKLRQVDLSRLRNVTAEQLQQIQDQLREQGRALEEALVASGLVAGDGNSRMAGTEGGGPAELGIGGKETIGNPKVPVILDLKEPGAVQIGDLLELREIEHEEASQSRVNTAGSLSTPGGSGSAVWRRDLPLDEQEVLRIFFQSNPNPNPQPESP